MLPSIENYAYLDPIFLVLEPLHVNLSIAHKLLWMFISNLMSSGTLVLCTGKRILKHVDHKILDPLTIVLR
jgi:hypothetical protein